MLREKMVTYLAVYGVGFFALLFGYYLFTLPSVYLVFVTVFSFTFSMVVALVLAKIIKLIIRKPRPRVSVRTFTLSGAYAFPSSHATTLITASLLFLNNSFIFGIIAFALSLLIMRSRVMSHVHDGIDMFGGAFLALVAFLLFHDHIYTLSEMVVSSFL